MNTKVVVVAQLPNIISNIRYKLNQQLPFCVPKTFLEQQNANNTTINGYTLRFRKCFTVASAATLTTSSFTSRNGVYTVGDFMTKKEDLVVVKPSTTVDEAVETLVEYKITGFPVINDNWELVGVVSDYDLLALDSISGSGLAETSMFPEVDSSWKVFNEIQILLNKTNGKLVSDVMTQVPVVVRETTNLEDAARLLLETRHRRLPVVNAKGKLVGIITRGNVIRAALQIKRHSEKIVQ